MEIDRA